MTKPRTAKGRNVMDKWISVNEKTPEFDEIVILAYDLLASEKEVDIGYLEQIRQGDGYKHLKWMVSQGCSEPREMLNCVTHWMPYPPPPKEA